MFGGHVPMCVNCGEYEVGAFAASTRFCSHECEWEAGFSDDDSGEPPQGSYDLTDDADALRSAGFGTDEDYGYYGGDEYE